MLLMSEPIYITKKPKKIYSNFSLKIARNLCFKVVLMRILIQNKFYILNFRQKKLDVYLFF
ncbi:hypothetical protein CN479_20165 [Bacillus thuringiensis]|nr:hypothetical protein CN479_20165 [Bacillus thuringiensis]